MNPKHRLVCWICLTALTVAGLKYVPTFLIEQRKLDQQERLLDMRETAFLRGAGHAPTVSMPAPFIPQARPQLL